MNVNQIYSTINSIRENMGTGDTNVIDVSSFVNFGNSVLSSATNKEIFYNALVDRIGKTVFAIRQKSRSNRYVTVDSFTFGCILQKISYKLQDAQANSDWSTQSENPYTLQAKGGIQQKLFAQSLPTFAYEDVIYDKQLRSAFTSPQAMAGFIDGLYTRMVNALNMSVDGMQNEAINASIATVFNNSLGTNASRRKRNLLAEYKAIFTDSPLTATTCLFNDNFWKYASKEMGIAVEMLNNLSTLYNDGTVERVTSRDNLVVEMSLDASKSFDSYLSADTYHNELVALPKFSTVAYWQTPSEPDTINVKLTSTGDEITVTGIIAYMRDVDNTVCTLEDERTVSMYDNWNDRTYVKMTADRRYIVDDSENSILFYVADEDTELTS